MKKKITFKGLWKVLKNSFSGFAEDKIMKKSASLAYYTVFSIGPLIIVAVFLASFFLEREAVEGQIYRTMNQFIGSNAAHQLQEMIKNTAVSSSSTLAIIIGTITLIIGATTVFADMQDSINTIWGLKAKPKSGILKMLKDRLLSFGVVASLGFLLLVSLGVSAIIEALNTQITEVFPSLEVSLVYIGNVTISFIIITLLFMIIFKVLPDAKIKWIDVLSGSIATAILFMVGKFGISLYISKADIGSAYGTAGSLVVILVWIYYSSIILYFGAEFTKAFAVEYGGNIHPNEYAVMSKTLEVEMEGKSVQDAEKEIKKKQQELDREKNKPADSENSKRR